VPLPAADRAAPLCWLHGFTQTGQSAHVFRSILAARRELLSPDLAGHGTHRDARGSLDQIADQVVAPWPPEPVDLGGYSFGARVALHVAIAHPHRVRRLVVISGTRGIADETARSTRRSRDEELATHVEEIGADAFIDEWLAGPMFAALPRDEAERATRDHQDAAGLAASLRDAGTGTQRWLDEEVRALAVPIFAVAGVADERFAREAREIAAVAPHGESALVPGAGHAVHLHQPRWSAQLVDRFLATSVRDEAGRREENAE
jgi:2-succinyl-6-hydroxy-2,4-cyclohexadiene-1-carboxylate synthase